MLNGPSEHPVQLEPPKKSSIHFVVPESIKCLTPANIIERLLAKHGILVAKYPWVYIVACLLLTREESVFTPAQFRKLQETDPYLAAIIKKN